MDWRDFLILLFFLLWVSCSIKNCEFDPKISFKIEDEVFIKALSSFCEENPGACEKREE